MNQVLKVILVITGFALIGYAIYFKNTAIQSPASAVESSLLNAARQDPDLFSHQFSEFVQKMNDGWDPVLVIGLLVVLASAVIKSRPNPQ